MNIITCTVIGLTIIGLIILIKYLAHTPKEVIPPIPDKIPPRPNPVAGDGSIYGDDDFYNDGSKFGEEDK